MSGWRKRTIMEMAREAGFMAFEYPALIAKEDLEKVEAFAAMVREDERDKWMERTAILIRGEREACAKVCEDSVEYAGDELARQIRARGQT